MEITEEQLNERLNSPDNLANRIRNGKIIPRKESGNATIIESGISGSEEKETPCGSEIEESESIGTLSTFSEPISFRTLKRPGNCRPWLSKSERTGIKIAATSGCGGKEIAKTFGVQVSTVSDILNDKRRAEDSPRSADQSKVDEALDRVREAAIDKLMDSLGQITSDKISVHTAKDISAIAANMSKVVKDTIPDKVQPQSINLVVYTPELRNEKSFEVIEI